MLKKPFVLSGGGARGFAHLGVVKALQEHDIFPSEISGTSSGAIAGAFLADGFTPDEIKEMFTGKFKFNLLSWNSFKLGLMSMKGIREFIEKNLRHKLFEELTMPFYVTATNFIDGRQKIFHQGEMIDAIIASSSIPAVFPPVFIEGVPYVDGGLSNNLPIEPFSERKNDIVAVYVNPVKPFSDEEGVLEVLDRAVHLSFREMVNRSATDCFLYIEPTELHQFGLFEIQKLSEIFDAGYSYTNTFLIKGNFNDYLQLHPKG